MKNLATMCTATMVVLFAVLGCSRLGTLSAVDLYQGDGAAKAAAAIKDKIGAMSPGGAAGKPEHGILVLPDDLVLSASREIAHLAQEKRLPTFFPTTEGRH